MPKHHAGSGLEYRLTEERGGVEESNNQRQQQHKEVWLPVGVENLAQGIEPDNFLLCMIIRLIRIISSRKIRVGMADNGAIGQTVGVSKYHAVDQRQHV